MKIREVLKLLQEQGWYICRIKGSHRQLKNSQIKGTVTVAGHLGGDIHPKILGRIRQQASPKK